MGCCGKTDVWHITITRTDNSTMTVISHGKTVWKAVSIVYQGIDTTDHESWLCENTRSGVAVSLTIEKIKEVLHR